MVTTHRKKSSRQHGETTHGWGSMKKHRGAGNRGGRGKAGTGKRADVKKPTYEKKKNYFGKHGFTSKHGTPDITITLASVQNSLDTWVKKGKAEKKGNTISVDLGKMGYTKLLCSGQVSKSMNITINKATSRAIEKVKKAGGSVGVLTPAEVSEKKESAKE